MIGALRLGIVTIGQSPRSDVLPDFIDALGFLPAFEQLGLLDGLSCEGIASLAPRGPDDQTLVTRLRDGTEVKLSEKSVVERLPLAVEEMERRSVDFIVLFCTGEFPPVESRVPVLYPSAIVSAVVSAVFSSKKNGGARLCVIAPASEQIPMLARKWGTAGVTLLFESLSPYTSGDSELLDCAGRVARLQCDMVVLDCIGYTEKVRAAFAQATGRPVILPRSLLARVAAELAAG
ncbi:conserved hypothetical protein [uncultured spirochete]|uniref:AroM family protein n=1 Tax=uncultured spirochete TaxID=156406 RepID=A0A3P3XP75_9SPIR|nr:conserved hypothetical protein [uncultured spirochete]